MKTAAELKRFFKEKLGVTGVRVRTIPCKAKWMEVWIPSERGVGDKLVYTQTIPLAFRQLCLKIVYPNVTEPWIESGNAGNVKPHSISMLPAEWDRALLWSGEPTPIQPENYHPTETPLGEQIDGGGEID